MSHNVSDSVGCAKSYWASNGSIGKKTSKAMLCEGSLQNWFEEHLWQDGSCRKLVRGHMVTSRQIVRSRQTPGQRVDIIAVITVPVELPDSFKFELQ